MDELPDFKSPKEDKMSRLHWDRRVLGLPIYRRGDGQVETARTYSDRLRALGFRARVQSRIPTRLRVFDVSLPSEAKARTFSISCVIKGVADLESKQFECEEVEAHP